MGGKILVIEDDAQLVNMLRETLSAQGYSVETAPSGKEGQAILSDSGKIADLKLVILDRMLGDMDGVQLIQEIQEKTQGKVHVLVLSSLSTEKDVLQGLQKGAVEYLTKPFNMNILLEKVAKLAA